MCSFSVAQTIPDVIFQLKKLWNNAQERVQNSPWGGGGGANHTGGHRNKILKHFLKKVWSFWGRPLDRPLDAFMIDYNQFKKGNKRKDVIDRNFVLKLLQCTNNVSQRRVLHLFIALNALCEVLHSLDYLAE